MSVIEQGRSSSCNTATSTTASNNEKPVGNSENRSDATECTTKKKRKTRRNRKMRYAPYSAKHFLGRPKINAPANTTQFLFDDKEPDFHCQLLKNESELSDQAKNSSQSNMSSEDETAQPSIPLNCSSDNVNDDNHNGYLMCDSIEDDKFHTEEFDRLYDNIRMEMLRTEPVDELTSRCMELETAIHNLRYLLQKESTTRSKLNEIVHLRERNAELTKENENLRKACNAGFQINAPHKLETGDDS